MTTSLTQRDRQVIWHPYTQHKGFLPPIPVVKGKGSLLFDDEGNAYIDAISSWWVNIHGHAHPYIAEKLYQQALRLEHVIFTGFTHEPAVALAERLLPLLPGDFSRVFYSDNGSTAVEVAIKMAIQYWSNQADTGPSASGALRARPGGRNKVLAFHHSYHGDTFGAMSVSERSVFTDAFREYLFEPVFIDTPSLENLDELLSFLRLRGKEFAGIIYEPLLQGAGGMRMYDAASLDRFLSAAAGQGILCIADEVLTGFGRTGKLFAGEYLQHKADIICLSKGLTGGTMALGVTATTERIFEAFLSDDKRKTLFHGHSFTANPLACTAALASLDLLEEGRRGISYISGRHARFLETLPSYPIVRNARALGTILAFEINTGRDEYINAIAPVITRDALAAGIYLRPLGSTVYFMPPYCITEKEMDQVYDFLVHCLVQYAEQPVT
ncbi:adenosylmethionine--8-amino-7-oxononanoate transaminase [Puia dinghuensis]|uniref:Adenosylmethionine-8-amino-7-oxononanoate aminotransferase n=1 Tax=Puia dinghuensis TaxID=1792502 RepID=A0A8J2U911_9BACT|nr:adenosylmethionine--8-amino-7-oxononanoate transaminase [Puia dinghuensis]GGA87339.1 adenosylmethionine--8-amino-7-oxononanoate aminotransferase BioA [Puia dinghuensis]